MAVKVETLVHVSVPVTDVARARKFYAGLLGFDETERPGSFTFPGAWFRVGAVLLQLEGQTDPVAESTRRVAFWVDDIQAARRTLAAAGTDVVEARPRVPGVRRLQCSDPDGNRIELQGPDRTTLPA
jgi:glyoxylase I family protein